MVDINPVNKNTVVNVNSSGSVSEIKTTTPQHYYDGLAKQWAISADKVQGLDYSSKYYAEKSRESAQNAQAYVEQVNNVKNEAVTEITTTKNETIDGLFNILNTSKEEILQIEENAIKNIEEIKEDSKELIVKEAQEQLKNIESTGFYMRDDKLYFINSEGEEEEFKSGGGGLEIGDVAFTQMAIDETKGTRRKLNGQIIIQEQYQELTNILKASIAQNPDMACTEQEWQAEVTMSTAGICYKFVVDDEGGTIRLPKYPNYFIGGINDIAPVVGNGLSLGLTNGSGNYGIQVRGTSNVIMGVMGTSAESYGEQVGVVTATTTPTMRSTLGVTTDPTKSGMEAQIKQEKIKGQYFIQVATGAETEDNIINEIELNNPFFLGMSQYFESEPNNISWLKSAGQYNAKAIYPTVYDWALINANNGIEGFKLVTDTYTDYDYVINTADETFRLPLLNGSEDLPSDKYNGLTLEASGTTYTAPANGYFYFEKGVGKTSLAYVQLKNITNGMCSEYASSGSSTNYAKAFLPVKKGDTVRVSYDASGSTGVCRFIYAQGNGSLYFYVGETVQNANLVNIGRIEEKVASLITIVETYQNGTSWYRVYSDGWCEQGGAFTTQSGVNQILNLVKPYKDTNYCVYTTSADVTDTTPIGINAKVKDNNSFYYVHGFNGNTFAENAYWEAKGYIS